MRRLTTGFLVLCCGLGGSGPALFAADAADAAAGRASTFVDADGVMRWTASGEELVLFGANYCAPFAHGFRAHRRLGVDLEKAIAADVYHLARLGFDAYRVHVWDREISDADGNLVVNDQMRAFDFLVAELKRRGIRLVLTPLQFGNAGYPEPGVALAGFSSKYGKQGCLEDRTSWPLQERYLAQFVGHVNPHTGLAYKDDPDVVAFEICNEPGHFEYAPTVEYINRMVAAIRGTGAAQPIFYNMSHGLPVFEAYLDADVQGGTFQWYPANLVAGHEQHGNFLPYVDDYPIPFADHPKFRRKAKIVYEFDAADIGRSYIYAAMARTYRTAGMQIATHFAYDPLAIAPFNTEYQTHYLNLAYAPSKSLGMMVAAEAFRRVPRGRSFGVYPHNTSFAGVRVSYLDDLAELVTTEKFLHSNSTSTPPPAPDELAQVAGYGRSPIVDYPGQGAYFLDRLAPGVWRLEVMPDAIWVRDPYEKPSPGKHVSRLAWNEWPMRLALPDLGGEFRVAGVNDGNTLDTTASAGAFRVRPGAYVLTRQGLASSWQRTDRWRLGTLSEFVAPPPSVDQVYVLHTAAVEATAGRDLQVTATVAAPFVPEVVELVAYLPRPPVPPPAAEGAPARGQPGRFNAAGVGVFDTGGARVFPMTAVTGFAYRVDLPGAEIFPGTLRYHIVVRGPGGNVTTLPSGLTVEPTDWRFHGTGWTTRVVSAGAPVMVFDAAADARAVTADDRDVVYELVPADRPGTSAMQVMAGDLTKREHDHSFRFFCREKIRARADGLGTASQLVLFGKSATGRSCRVQLALVTSDGVAYGTTVNVPAAHARCAVAIRDLKPVRSPNIPHGYPVFIPFWSPPARDGIALDLAKVEAVLVSIGPGLTPADHAQSHGVEIERIWLE